MNKLFEIRKLSNEFYKDYPSTLFPEMEHKLGRPYVVLLIRLNDLQFAIPFRTNIRHAYCYKFSTSNRPTDSDTGIDFSKAVVITKNDYLDDISDINKKEYIELESKAFFIFKQFTKYVNDYIKFKKSGGNEYVARRYKFSTLKYFDDLLLKN